MLSRETFGPLASHVRHMPTVLTADRMPCPILPCQEIIPRPKYETGIDLMPLNLCLLFMREENLFHEADSDLFHSNERARPNRYKDFIFCFLNRNSLGLCTPSRTISTRGVHLLDVSPGDGGMQPRWSSGWGSIPQADLNT